MTRYVSHYFREILETGDIEELPFTEIHASEARTNFLCWDYGTYGITRTAALELVNKWNHSNKYRYRIKIA